MYAVYELVDRRDSRDQVPFYVGCSQKPIDRYIQHLKVDEESEKYGRIEVMIEQGRLPGMNIIEWVETQEIALMREAFWIEFYRAAGMPLTNQVVSLNTFTAQDKALFTTLQRWHTWRMHPLQRLWLRLIGVDNYYRDFTYTYKPTGETKTIGRVYKI
jgi:hypothetical protein